MNEEDTPNQAAAGVIRSISPNPFNPTARIKFTVREENPVQLLVFDVVVVEVVQVGKMSLVK